MSELDPQQKLSRFGSEFEGGAMPLPPSEIRRRGDRIRRRRNAVVAGGAALALAAIAVPVLALTGDGGDKDTLPANEPEPVTPADLLSDAETVYSDGADWFATRTFSGDGQAAFHPCTRTSFEGLGATSVQQRYFELLPTNLRPGDTYDGPTGADELSQAVARFDSPREAQAAYDAYTEWVQDCTFLVEQYGDDASQAGYRTFEPVEVDQPIGGEATILQANYGNGELPEELDPYGDMAYITETGLAVSGTRLTVARIQIAGQDYNFLPEDGGTPMQQMLPVAAELMMPGGDERPAEPRPDLPTQEDPAAPASSTSLPDAFDLTAGWDLDPASYEVTQRRDGVSLAEISPQDACGAAPDLGAPTDRVTAEAGGPTQGYGREVLLYADAASAQAAMDSLVTTYDGCSRQTGAAGASDLTVDVRPDVLGEESRRLVELYSVDGEPVTESTQVLWVGRFDNALLVLAAVEEGGGTEAAGNALLDSELAAADPVVTALEDLVAGEG